MEILKLDSLPKYGREFNREVFKLFSKDFENENAAIYLGMAPTGYLEEHMHTSSTEIIFFPIGGSLKINGEKFNFGPWDGVLLHPGDVHGWPHKGKETVLHLAIKFPDIDDRVVVQQTTI